MLRVEKIKENITYIGALDPELEVFDIVMKTDFGTTYNSYLIDGGEDIALVDTAKEHYFEEYVAKLEELTDLNKIKYLIVNHTEPDHSGEVHKLLEKIPHLTIVGTPTAIGFLKDISNKNFNSIEVKENFELNVGNKTLSFTIAPNLHWPDSMFTYVKEDKVLLTCDVFGAHYSTENVYNDSVENHENYMEAFKYYHDAIFGPFKPFVISGLNKIKDFELDLICPSHGPVLRENLQFYKDKYREWAEDVDEIKGKISLIYTSAYGYTAKIAEEIAKAIRDEGFDPNLIDLLEKTKEEAIFEIKSSEAFLIGSPTINGDCVPPIWDLLLSISSMDVGCKMAGAFGAFGWSGEAIKNIESRLSMLKCNVFRPGLKIKFNPDDEIKLRQAYNFGKSFIKKLMSTKRVCNDEWVQIKTGKWKCLVCGEIYEGEYPPETCPACGAPADQFIEIKDDKIEFSNNTDEKIFIIGSGVAAVSAIESIRKRNKKAYVEMISEEDTLPYYRILLSKKLTCPQGLELLKRKEWFDENNVKVSLGKKVFRVIPDENKIIFQDGTYVNYDKLIIATGARNNIIPIHGDDKRGVFNLRNKADFENINEFAKKDNIKDVVVIGGGILGIEMAAALKQNGKNVTVVEFAPRLMIRQIDVDGAKIFQKHLEDNEIRCLTSETVSEIYGTGEDFKEVCGVLLNHSQEKIDCQMVVEAMGVKPNIELVNDTSVEKNRGIIVNDKMQTSVENIYTCGDVAEFNGKNMGLWPIALDMGKVAGANAIGDNSVKYIEKPISTSFNSLGYKIFSIGDLGLDPHSNYQMLELSDPQNEIYRKFYFLDNEFVGGLLMGDTRKAVQLRVAIDRKSDMQSFLDNHFLDE